MRHKKTLNNKPRHPTVTAEVCFWHWLVWGIRQAGTHLTAIRNVPNLLNPSIDNDFLNKQNSGVLN